MKRAVIIGSSPIRDWTFAKKYIKTGDFIIAADGGRKVADALNLKVDYYVGDSDSGGFTDEKTPSDILPSEKDVTDLDMGVSRAIKEGFDNIIMLGCTGGREDHHFSAIGQLERIYRTGAVGIIADPENEIQIIAPGKTIVKSDGAFHYFGIVPLDFEFKGVSITGAKYEVSSVDIQRTSSLGISNEPKSGADAVIAIQSGLGLLIRSKRIK